MRRLVLAAALLATALPAPGGGDAPAASPRPAAPRIVVEPASFDFGTVRATRSVQKEFLVRNHGKGALVIESVTTDCGCTAALTDSTTVKPGASTPLRVTLTAPETPGRVVKTVLIGSNDPARPRLTVEVAADVVTRGPRGR